MDANTEVSRPHSWNTSCLTAVVAVGVLIAVVIFCWNFSLPAPRSNSTGGTRIKYEPRFAVEESGFQSIISAVPPWSNDATLEELREVFNRIGFRTIEHLDKVLEQVQMTDQQWMATLYTKIEMLQYEGEPKQAYELLGQLRSQVEQNVELAPSALYTVIFLQGVAALRRGENENCILCRGESSCILPISKAAIHTNPEGSRLAIQHFTEYLEAFPDDLEVRWLLNLSHMTLGEHPQQVDSRFLVSLEHYQSNEFNIGKFRDIGHLVGVNSFNQSGGAVMDDFDNDGLLDLVTTTFDATSSMNVYRNNGHGGFETQTSTAGVVNQLGGLNCSQTDFNNDGFLDLFIVRGAWMNHPMRPSLLRNNQDGTFTDVTAEAGLLHPVNSIAASWADYDNDGWLDLFVSCERQPCRLYHNLGNNTFEEVLAQSGIQTHPSDCKGIAWLDYDNDGDQDLFLNYFLQNVGAQLYRNEGGGHFIDVTQGLGINGPELGFSCWSWDYDNDGWLDIFATCYVRNLGEVVKGLQGLPHDGPSNRLFHNRQGLGFDDVTKASNLDLTFTAMGSNFADFDNDGFLDFYLGTGTPNLSMLVPNRMFKNVGGQRFAELTASSGTGSLQKGHGVACGDWDRDGNVDIFIEMGGATNGDKYHNILFQNPGHQARFLTLKLIGTKSNRAAIGARIKIVTAGRNPQTIHRMISSGSSFGANPMQQTIGLAQAERIALLEIRWPTSGTTQVFQDLAVDQALEITEFATDYRQLDWKPIPLPKEISSAK